MTGILVGAWAGLCLIGIPAILASAYLLLLTLLSARPAAPLRTSARKFDVIVPAHNEATGIVRTLESLQRVEWPRALFRIIVVADNCTDATAVVAATGGAIVLERRDEHLRGKGYALNFAFERSRSEAWASAVVVVDADSVVSGNFLEAIAARLDQGAHAVQVDYAVLNPHDSWRTRLIAIALGAFHRVRSRAREHLRVSCGIRGNGWCVTHGMLELLPYRAFSLTEDIEYGIDLGLAGARVHYCDEAQVYGEMVSNSQNAGKQRQRWEQGRFELIRNRVPPLLSAALHRRSRVCLDLALDLLVLPLSFVALNVVVFFMAALLASHWLDATMPALIAALACIAALCVYVLRGWQLSKIGWRGLVDLAYAPLFVIWKVIVLVTRGRTTQWVRTERERS